MWVKTLFIKSEKQSQIYEQVGLFIFLYVFLYVLKGEICKKTCKMNTSHSKKKYEQKI